jgi:hypothetical protein
LFLDRLLGHRPSGLHLSATICTSVAPPSSRRCRARVSCRRGAHPGASMRLHGPSRVRCSWRGACSGCRRARNRLHDSNPPRWCAPVPLGDSSAKREASRRP